MEHSNITIKMSNEIINKQQVPDLNDKIQYSAMNLPDMNIALSGMAGRFPKSDSVQEFEDNLLNNRDMCNDNDESRFPCRLWNLPPRAGRLKDLSKFDAQFFGYSTEEANYIDFQLRILYEVVYESILDSGVNPASLRGTRTGVFFGLHCNEFENAMADHPSYKSNGYYTQFAVKVAQYFDLRGMTVTFDAACASGFVGLHNAVQAIKDDKVDQAIVCSSNIPIHPTNSFIFLQMQMLSPTGYSRFLDSRADGYVKSESCCSVFLQKKNLALRNYASFLVTMTGVDGFKPEGITFPSDKSQEQLIRQAKELAGVTCDQVEYIEAHGTGTPAGDPQEARAISSVYTPLTGDDKRTVGPLLVGSVKTNMGHSEAASGLCSLTKVALMLENELIYGGLHFENPNINIEALKDGRIQFVRENCKLNGKIIPLSCYGFGGSNVHAIVRANERPAINSLDMNNSSEFNGPRLVVMFARTREGLDRFFDDLLKTDKRATRNCLSDDFLCLINALNSNKIDRLMSYRGFLLLDRSMGTQITRDIKLCELRPAKKLEDDDIGKRTHIQEVELRKCNIILPGVGCQWPAMAQGLAIYSPFWSSIEEISQQISYLNINLKDLMTRPQEGLSMAELFVSIVSYQIALIRMIKQQLCVNQLHNIVGHSLGEVSCGYASGCISDVEAVLVAYQMGKTLDDNKSQLEGKMVAVGCSHADINEFLLSKPEEYKTIRVCCVNGRKSITLSGSSQDIDKFCQDLLAKWVDVLLHPVENMSIALHNELIMNEDIKAKLAVNIGNVLKQECETPDDRWVSSFKSDARKGSANYYADCLCGKVDFLTAIERLDEDSIVLELGPSGIFESQFKLMDEKNLHYVKLMRRLNEPAYQINYLLESLGRLYQVGATFDLNRFYSYFSSKGKPTIPVKRQTPSISSLFKWDHRISHFVPRYPQQFSKSSAKTEMPVDIVQDRDKYLAGHCIEGRVLFPATGYLFLIWRVFSFTKRKIFDATFNDVEHELVPIEFIDVRLMRAVILGNRSAQIYIQLEEATGHFEIKEGGSVVVEGYARSPVENATGLIYEDVKQKIMSEKLQLELKSDDIYKQFRVSGYDYGESFRNIESSSLDGRYSRVKHNGHFIALTDSILQSIFLAITQYAPSGGLFLPTKFDYVRFQPEIILAKMREAQVVFDYSDGSLNTKAKREIMTKIMERESAAANGVPQVPVESEEANETKIECIFETFCDPITGVIITDGIEMRGIKATPAPRRSDSSNEVLMESYQFVRDIEDPVDDESLTNFKCHTESYVDTCDLMAIQILEKLFFVGKNKLELEEFRQNLKSCRKDQRDINELIKSNYLKFLGDEFVEYKDPKSYDIRKNGDRMLMSVLDQLLAKNHKADLKTISQLVEDNRLHLMQDLIQKSIVTERLMRPMSEIVVENICTTKMKLRVVEINQDDGLMRDHFVNLMKKLEPTLAIDYSLAHPDIERLVAAKLISTTSGQLKTFQLKDLDSLIEQSQVKNSDLIIYKDISCYSLPKQVIEQNGLSPVVSSLSRAVKKGGYVMLVMRSSLTLAERILLALSQPQLVGLNKKYLESFRSSISSLSSNITTDQLAKTLQNINEVLESRSSRMIEEAERSRLLLISKRIDPNGCTILLFRRVSSIESNTTDLASIEEETQNIVIQITHDNQEDINSWLEKLKSHFNKTQPDQVKGDEQQVQIVWLCAVATKEKPISGLVGMMQALRKELGSYRLRCFYDAFTFKNSKGPVECSQIEESANFQFAISRGQLWNCIDSNGNWGAYRHFTINDYLSYNSCACNSQELIGHKNTMNGPVSGAYVNNATRGDLSSFTWFEAPFNYLSEKEKSALVRVAYSAMNFRDIMLATGRLPLDAIPIKLAMTDCLLGLEFSGYDARGVRVMGMVYGRGIATHVICPENFGIKIEIPEWMSLKEAATIPVCYATAIMALIYRGRMRRGESILIHAGSGGVGQAAIRLAAHFGLTIYTTVGTNDKREFLLQEFPGILSEDRIFSSRDCNFEAEILKKTQGQGVNLVLNSLADDKLQASIACLADGGRFLEIGKYDLSINTRLELLKLDNNKTFHGILLDKLFDVQDIGPSFARQLACVVETLREGMTKGFVKPIKYKLFKRNKIEQAFRFMATGKHIGKVLIEIDSSLEGVKNTTELASGKVTINCVPRFQLSSEKTYIITGGLGGFGMELCKWLVNQGAKHIILTSRSGVRTGYQRATLKRLESNDNVKFLLVNNQVADTTTAEGCQTLCRLATDFAANKQIGGIFHLAMVLKDSLLENMTSQDFMEVIRPKLETCGHLNRLLTSESLGYRLDYFVAFSSVTSGKGNAGQANYAYANSYLERVCEKRHNSGEHGLAIQWGAIGDVGVAFENLGGNDVIIGGTIPQRIPSCLTTLARLLGSPFHTCLSVVPLNRSSDTSGEKADLLGAIMHVLGIKDPSKVSEQSTLGDLGLDSLMAVEIRQYIEREYDKTLNIQEIRSLTVGKIKEMSENEQVKVSGISVSSDENKGQNESTESKTLQSNGVDMREASSYGIKTNVSSTKSSPLKTIDATLNRTNIGSYLPKLELPEDDFIMLNRQRVETSEYSESNPIFFLPPIHGDFESLKLICENIRRPCIGLNWTRRFGDCTNIDQVVVRHLEVLQSFDWFTRGTQNGLEIRKVDLVGYSFGATIAFEMMAAIKEMSLAGGPVIPGHLILLDGSPKQIEMSSELLSSLKSSGDDRELVTELLVLYMLSHTRNKQITMDYGSIRRKMSMMDVNQKLEFAATHLVELLSGKSVNFMIDKDTNKAKQVRKMMDAMRAFCRKYQQVNSYKADTIISTDCTLIRAREIYLVNSEQKSKEDYNLSSVVSGKLKVHVLDGDHESFLRMNSKQVGKIVTEQMGS